MELPTPGVEIRGKCRSGSFLNQRWLLKCRPPWLGGEENF